MTNRSILEGSERGTTRGADVVFAAASSQGGPRFEEARGRGRAVFAAAAVSALAVGAGTMLIARGESDEPTPLDVQASPQSEVVNPQEGGLAQTESTVIVPESLPPELQELADEVEQRWADGMHPVPDAAGEILGWVTNETISSPPAESIDDLGEVYDDEGNVIAYYDTLAGVIDKSAVESGTFDLAAAQQGRIIVPE
jgi:hypothetical protein